MIRLPNWLYVVLIPVMFFGGCYFSGRPVSKWLDSDAIHLVSEEEKPFFPVLIRTADGRYAAALLGDIPEGASIVLSVAQADEDAINHDLRDSVGSIGGYRYFRILSSDAGSTYVSLQVPTRTDSKRMGWYRLSATEISPHQIVSYGPGFAFLVVPWMFLAGVATVLVYLALVRIKKKPNQPAPDNERLRARV